jgi:hypothetical protein
MGDTRVFGRTSIALPNPEHTVCDVCGYICEVVVRLCEDGIVRCAWCRYAKSGWIYAFDNQYNEYRIVYWREKYGKTEE